VKVDLATEITPAKLRSGGPAALAGLCDRRGAAVFAYCQQAAGPDGGAAVAAEAFAEFRRAILPAESLTSGAQAETLLRAASQRAALVHIRAAAAGGVGQPLPAPPPPPPPLPPPVQARPQAPRPQAPPAAGAGSPRRRRPRLRLPSFGRAHFGPSRSAILLRGAAKLVAVLVAAGAAGILLGLAMAELTGDDAAPTPSAAVPTSSTPRATTATAATTAPATTEKVRIAVRSATARPPANGAEQGSRLTVRASIENAGGRAIRTKQPELLVDDLRVAAAPESRGTGGELPAPSLADGATAAGTLRFDVPLSSPSELTTARVRVRLAGKIVVLSPNLARPRPAADRRRRGSAGVGARPAALSRSSGHTDHPSGPSCLRCRTWTRPSASAS